MKIDILNPSVAMKCGLFSLKARFTPINAGRDASCFSQELMTLWNPCFKVAAGKVTLLPERSTPKLSSPSKMGIVVLTPPH